MINAEPWEFSRRIFWKQEELKIEKKPKKRCLRITGKKPKNTTMKGTAKMTFWLTDEKVDKDIPCMLWVRINNITIGLVISRQEFNVLNETDVEVQS